MTAKKTSNTEPETIEGVAVEKPAASTGRGRAAGRTKSGAGREASDHRSNPSANPFANPTGDDMKPDDAESVRPPDSSTGTSSKVSSASKMPAILSVAAILLALAGIAVQHWMTARQETQLRTEIETLAAQLEAAHETLANTQIQITALGTSQDGVVSRLAGLEAALPQDPAEALATLTARLDTLAAEMTAILAASETAPPSYRAGLVESGLGESGLGESGLGESGLALAQAGLGAATAMNAANLNGGDPAQWVPVLRELARAGLDVGDVEAIAAVLTPRPPSAAQLLAEGGDLVALIQQDRHGDSGWWQNTTGRIAGFIRLRRSTDAPATEETAAQKATPLETFAGALRSGGIGGGLGGALAASRAITPPPAGLADWQIQAQRRLDLDAALVGLMVQLTAQITAQMTAHPGAAGVAE